MSSKVQYSPHPDIVDQFRMFPFAYDINDHEGVVISSVNRIRKYVEQVFGIRITKNILRGVLHDISGEIIGDAVNTYGHISQICKFHVWSFRRRVEIALQSGEIQGR